jgi:hypothetical protein
MNQDPVEPGADLSLPMPRRLLGRLSDKRDRDIFLSGEDSLMAEVHEASATFPTRREKSPFFAPQMGVGNAAIPVLPARSPLPPRH